MKGELGIVRMGTNEGDVEDRERRLFEFWERVHHLKGNIRRPVLTEHITGVAFASAPVV